MEIKNGRLIINEDEIDDAIEQIRQIIQDKLDELGHGNVIVDVDFYENCNESCTLFWNELDINLMATDGFLGSIEFRTESLENSLAFINDKFEFYYVLTFLSNTCTSLKYMTNIGFCDFDKDNDKLLENVLLEELRYNLEN